MEKIARLIPLIREWIYFHQTSKEQIITLCRDLAQLVPVHRPK
ncbi:hypothetical protein FM107_05100 [Sphingobacterium sp. JB170]|nr:hypothetical protein FM107_05100 [Sphingobacterium sp. JB170]